MNQTTRRHMRQLRLARLGRGVSYRRRFRTVTELAASRLEALRSPDGDPSGLTPLAAEIVSLATADGEGEV